LDPYLYVLTINALGYLLDGFEIVNNHFVNDSLLFVSDEWGLVDGSLACLDTLCVTSSSMVSSHKNDYWLVGMDTLLDWIPTTQTHIQTSVIVRCLGIPFGVVLFLVSMWDWCL